MTRIAFLDHDVDKLDDLVDCLRLEGYEVDDPVVHETDLFSKICNNKYDLVIAHPEAHKFRSVAATIETLSDSVHGTILKVIYIGHEVPKYIEGSEEILAVVGLRFNKDVGFYFFANNFPEESELVEAVDYLTTF